MLNKIIAIIANNKKELLASKPFIDCERFIINRYKEYAAAMRTHLPELHEVEKQLPYLLESQGKESYAVKQANKKKKLIECLNEIVDTDEISLIVANIREIDECLKGFDYNEHTTALLTQKYFQDDMLEHLKASKVFAALFTYIREEYSNSHISLRSTRSVEDFPFLSAHSTDVVHASPTASLISSTSSYENLIRLATPKIARRATPTNSGLHGILSSTHTGCWVLATYTFSFPTASCASLSLL